MVLTFVFREEKDRGAERERERARERAREREREREMHRSHTHKSPFGITAQYSAEVGHGGRTHVNSGHVSVGMR